jgi:DNA-binding response OmpR family regulator
MKRSLLVVDDEAPTREMLSLFFRTRGFEVFGTESAEGAVKRLGESIPDVIILDINLGRADGFQFLEQCKKLHPEVPVIMLTGLGYDEELMARSTAGGASGYMSKTEPLADLLKEVQRVLNAGIC